MKLLCIQYHVGFKNRTSQSGSVIATNCFPLVACFCNYGKQVHVQPQCVCMEPSSLSPLSPLSLCGSVNYPPPTPPPGADKFVGGHHFKTNSFTAARWCDVCGRYMWGLVRQGMKCKGRWREMAGALYECVSERVSGRGKD